MSRKQYRATPLLELEFLASLLTILAGSRWTNSTIESDLETVRAELVRRTFKTSV